VHVATCLGKVYNLIIKSTN